MSDMKPILKSLSEGRTLSDDALEAAFTLIFAGEASHTQMAAFLMGLSRARNLTNILMVGARVMRTNAIAVKAPKNAIDTCGTGGDGAHTYNISTAAALVVAACGVSVAKHGGRAATSKSGSAEVLEALGVRLDLSPDGITRCIKQAGIGFMFAVNHHPAMRHVAPVRQELGFRTIFNMLGPLANPAGVKRQLVGVFSQRLVRPYAEVLRALGSEKAWVVHGTGLDELTTTGKTHIAILSKGKITEREITPESVGLERVSKSALRGGNAQQNAKALRTILTAKNLSTHLPYRDVVLLNAAAALCVADKARNLKEGIKFATVAIENGKASKTIDKLVSASCS